MLKRLVFFAVLPAVQTGCFIQDLPPHLPAVDVIVPVPDTCACGDGACVDSCHENAATCPDDCVATDAMDVKLD